MAAKDAHHRERVTWRHVCSVRRVVDISSRSLNETRCFALRLLAHATVLIRGGRSLEVAAIIARPQEISNNNANKCTSRAVSRDTCFTSRSNARDLAKYICAQTAI